MFWGGGGGDTLDGEGGDDTAVYWHSNAGVIIDLDGGRFITGSGGDAAGDRLQNIENIYGSDHADRLIGDDEDNLFQGAGGGDTLDGENGNDTAVYWESAAGIIIDLSIKDSDGFTIGSGGDAQGDRLRNIENIMGSENADTINGDDNINIIYSGGGDDIIGGGGGGDTLDGGDGEDTASYYGGADIGITIDLSIKDNDGFTIGSGGDAAGDKLRNIENIWGTMGDDRLTGDDGDNLLWGSGGGDTLDGGEGIDIADYRESSSGVTVVLDGGRFTTASGGDATGDSLKNIEHIYGSIHADTLTGDDGDNLFWGGGGGDTIDGGGGVDIAAYGSATSSIIIDLSVKDGDGFVTVLGGGAAGDKLKSIEHIWGSSHADTLTGDDGDNLFWGAGGDDIIIGGLGDNIVTGGSGRDSFIQQVGHGQVGGTNSLTVTDFGFGDDVLTLVDSDANLLGDTFYDLSIADGDIAVELITDVTNVLGLSLTIGANDAITLMFADNHRFDVADIKTALGLAEEVTLSDYFTDKAETAEVVEYAFTQTAFSQVIFDELLGDGGLEVLQSAEDTPYIV